MIIKKNFYFVLAFILFSVACKHRENKLLIREWNVVDLYRRQYPPYFDTIKENEVVFFNKEKVDSSFFDSVYEHRNYPSNRFSMDSLGTYEVIANTSFNIKGMFYRAYKISFLRNMSSEPSLIWVANKEIYIQLDNKHRKLFFLKRVFNKKGNNEGNDKLQITNKIYKDTIMFPILQMGNG